MIQLLEHFTYKKLIRFTIPTVAMMIFTSVFYALPSARTIRLWQGFAGGL